MNASCFKLLILPCYDIAFATAMAVVRNSDDACDITQEVFRKLWEKHESIEAPKSPRAFCAVSARNAALSWLRKQQNLPTDELKSEIADIIPDNTEADRRQHLFDLAFSRLDDRHRLLISLSIEGKTNHDIAEVFETSEANIRQMLSRTRQQLREIIRKIAPDSG